MNKSILVFAHMMKTAGTALTKQLIEHYGPKLHLVPGGLKWEDSFYKNESLNKDFEKLNGCLQVITGHPLRPHIDFEVPDAELLWFTFLRHPENRYVSHYLHDYEWSENFSYKRYHRMEDKSILEWEKIEKYSNYQTKFIAGELNLHKAIEILETKMAWVGNSDAYDDSILSFKGFFKLDNLNTSNKKTNTSLAKQEMKKKVSEKYSEFIVEHNEVDRQLYEYFLENIWPKFAAYKHEVNPGRTKPQILRSLNMLRYQVTRQLKFAPTQLTYKNLVRFYNRWYR